MGAHGTHGPLAGRFAYQSWAWLPKSQAKKRRTTAEAVAAAHGLCAEEVGPIDAERLLDGIWHAAGRGSAVREGWVRARALMVVLDKYAVPKRQLVEAAAGALKAADVHLWYLPSYRPELSRIEPDGNAITQQQVPVRRFEQGGELKRAVDDALARKAHQLQQGKSTGLRRADT